MIAAVAAARHWRAALLLVLLLSVTLLGAFAARNEGTPFDRLPLRGVSEAEYARTGITLTTAYDEQAAMDRRGAEFLAKEFVRWETIRQVVLVRLKRADSDGPGILSYAINYDPSTAPDFPCFGGPGSCPRVALQRDFDNFVLFLDANAGSHIYSLSPQSEYPFPESSDDGVVLYGVPPQQLAASAITLKKPPANAVPVYTEDNARAYVARRFQGATVSQVVLGQLTESSGELPQIYQKLVWVVNIDPSSLSVRVQPTLANRGSASLNTPQFALVFVDANNLEFVYFLSR